MRTSWAIRWRVMTLVGLVAVGGCTPPGTRGTGRGEAAWDGSPPVRWSGRCAYEVLTRWATRLPHVITLAADGSEWSIEISSPRRFSNGQTALEPTGEGGTQGLVLDGATVRGAVLGTLEISRSSDSTFVRIVGTKAYRDTVPLEASCRLGQPESPH